MRANMDRLRNGGVIAWVDGGPSALPLEIKSSWGDVATARYEPITLIVLPLTQKKLRTIDSIRQTSHSLRLAPSISTTQLEFLQPEQHGPVGTLGNNNPLSPSGGLNQRVLYVKLDLPKNFRDLAELGCA